MKKTLLSIAFAAMGLVAFAQKQAAGDMTLESQFNLNFATGPMGWASPYIRYRYFMDEGMAIRASLGINYSSSSQDLTSNPITSPAPSPAADAGTYKVSGSAFGIAIGAEKHFKGTEKLSPYMGAELLFAMTGAGMMNPLTGSVNSNHMNITATGTDTDTATFKSKNASLTTSGGGMTSFGLRLVFGADYYFTNSIYVGGEMGWGFLYNSMAEQTFITNDGTASAANVEGKSSLAHSSMDLSMMNHPTGSIRFGVKF